MTIDSIAAPKNARIAGTLHRRGYVHPIPVQDENLSGEKTDDREVADGHKDLGQEDHKGAH